MRGQVVLITGCSSGIGRATAREAARRGHRVFATARNPQDLAGIEEGGGITPLALDVTDPPSIARAVERVIREAGRLDAVVNNAGFAQYGAVEDVPAEQWRRQFEVNVFGAVEVIRAALPAMREARRGTIVNVSSVGGKLAIPFAAPYCASKHALEAISDALRVELDPFGIRVVVIEPGPITTRYGETARALVLPYLTRPGPYKPYYIGAERAMNGEFQRGKRPPEAVARVIVDAIESERPKARYRVGPMAKLLLPLRRVLSDRFLDARFRKTLR